MLVCVGVCIYVHVHVDVDVYACSQTTANSWTAPPDPCAAPRVRGIVISLTQFNLQHSRSGAQLLSFGNSRKGIESLFLSAALMVWVVTEGPRSQLHGPCPMVRCLLQVL